MDLSKLSTLELMEELMDRKDIEYAVGDKSWHDWSVMVEGGKWIKGSGAVTIVAVKGTF